MPAMAQRSAREVASILADHDRLVETAFVVCVECGERIYSLHRPPGTDAQVTQEFTKRGWEPRKGTGWLCPTHSSDPHLTGCPRCDLSDALAAHNGAGDCPPGSSDS